MVTFDKKPEYIEADYVMVWVPQRRHTDSVMTRPVIKKTGRRMYQQGHYARVKRPSGPELYEDASRILDELLQKQLSVQVSSLASGRGRPHRFKTHPSGPGGRRHVTVGDVLDERDEFGLDADNGIERSKTMPSRAREDLTKDESSKAREADILRLNEAKWKNSQDALSASSADTEGDSMSVTEHRKKKSLLQKAKDRFLHAFHREEREKEKKLKEKDGAQYSPKKQKKKDGKGDSVRQNGAKDSPKSRDKQREEEQSSEYGKRRNSAGKALLNSLRKSFSGRRNNRRTTGEEASVSGRSQSHTPSPEYDSHTPASSTLDSIRSTIDGNDDKHLTVPGSRGVSVSPVPPSLSTDSRSHAGNGYRSDSLQSFSPSQHSGSRVKNVLDDPADDIQYMDDSIIVEPSLPRNGQVKGSGSRKDKHSGERAKDANKERRPELRWQGSLAVDGDTDMHDGDRPLAQENEDDLPLHVQSEEEKTEMIKKVASKLNHIADTFNVESGLSDTESHSRGATARSDTEGEVLSELEKQIMDCLRDIGDRNTHTIDGPAEEVIQQQKAATYERFKTTVQHAMGEEISWDQLAVLFYTTKGVMSAVGRGSKLASDAKELTLRYFSDKFAKFIMDQGGFDSVLSESDSELD